MVIDEFVDPYSKDKLMEDAEGNLYSIKNGKRSVYRRIDGCYDFSYRDEYNAEREHYDRRTVDLSNKYWKKDSEKINEDSLYGLWHQQVRPKGEMMIGSLGDLSNKKILLIGNGMSYEELYFLCLGAKVVYSDLSIEAVLFMKKLYLSSELSRSKQDDIEFMQ